MFFKEEVLSMNPRIVLIQDVITDGEIDFIKKMAIPKVRTQNLIHAILIYALTTEGETKW